MTLILTAMDSTKIVQVADQRLTLDGRLYDDHAVKSIFVKSKDAAACVSYTGRAFIGPRRTRTDFWLCDNLQERAELPFPELTQSLAERLSAVDMAGDPLTMVLAAYADGTSWPVFCLLSNAHDAQGKELSKPLKEFSALYRMPSDNPKSAPPVLYTAGYEAALTRPARRTLRRFFRKRFQAASPSGCAELLMRSIREASRQSKLVGSNCIGIALIPGRDAEGFYWPEKTDAPVQLTPHIVTQSSAYRSGYVSRGLDSPSATIPFEDWPQLKSVIEPKGEFVMVTNASTDDWRNVRLDLNGRPNDYREIAKGFRYGPGYVHWIDFIAAGETAQIGASAFLKMAAGTSFNPTSEAIRELVLIAQLPDGLFRSIHLHSAIVPDLEGIQAAFSLTGQPSTGS